MMAKASFLYFMLKSGDLKVMNTNTATLILQVEMVIFAKLMKETLF